MQTVFPVRHKDWSWNGKSLESLPASLEAAQAEARELADTVADIHVALSISHHDLPDDEYERWRKRAMWGRRMREKRLSFLKFWMRDQNAKGLAVAKAAPRPSGLPGGIPTSFMMKVLANRMGYLEAVFWALDAYVADDSDEHWDALISQFERATEALATMPHDRVPEQGEVSDR